MNEVFGRYQIMEKITQGGMAEILLARPVSGTRNTCVLKRILPEFSGDPRFISMFIDEARITIRLHHPNVVQLYDFGQVDNVYFMAMEYVDGTDLDAVLSHHIASGKAPPPIVAAWVVREVLAGLSHAHKMEDETGCPLGVVHRDVSPQNVLLSISGEVKITDFGIAAAMHKLTLTLPGTVLGKVAYMAPEQAQGFAVRPAADLWAAGVILWEALAGSRLFADDHPLAVLQRVLEGKIVPPSTLRPGIPESLDRVVLTLLERDSDRRPRDAEAAIEALDLVIATLAQTSPLAITGRGDVKVFDAAGLAAWLSSLEWDEVTAPIRRPAPAGDAKASSTAKLTVHAVKNLSADAAVQDALDHFHDQQDPWLLVDVGDRAAHAGLPDVAVSAWRTAAAAFAYRGLLVQSLCAHSGVRRWLKSSVVDADVSALADLTPGAQDELDAMLDGFDQHDFSHSITRDSLMLPARVPLLGSLGPRELVQLAAVVTIRRVAKGEVILREGEAGDELYAVGRGGFVVSCSGGQDSASVSPGSDIEGRSESTANQSGVFIDQLVLTRQRVERVFLGALADGDFFGEFSFLAERPRSATVEAVTDGILMEIRRGDVEDIAAADPAFTAPLLEFYKERVVELMMAKSPVFSMLTQVDRKRLLDTATVLDVDDCHIIVAEGTRNDDLFFIKRGEVEVYRHDSDGNSIFINKLGAGQFFGEFAALKKTPRTVSVRAIGPVALFQIEGRALMRIVERDPDLKTLFEAMIQARTRETRLRTLEHNRMFFGV